MSMKEQDIQFIREFNRFYTNIIGLVDQHLLQSSFSLPEARILYELYHLQPCTASDIMQKVQIDKGYLSRVLAQFTRMRLLAKTKSKDDGRAAHLSLTAKGNLEFEKINQASIRQVKMITSDLSAKDKADLIDHMKGIKEILNQHEVK
jgi:DNA-binding MarR family transcriptional regulator